MLRVYIKKGHTEAKPNGARTLYAPGHYNLDDAKARAMVADGKAQLVDDNDHPVDDVQMNPFDDNADEPSAVIAFDEED